MKVWVVEGVNVLQIFSTLQKALRYKGCLRKRDADAEYYVYACEIDSCLNKRRSKV